NKYSALINENKENIDKQLEILDNLNKNLDNLEEVNKAKNLISENSNELEILKVKITNINTELQSDKRLKEENDKLREALAKAEAEKIALDKEQENLKETEEKSLNDVNNQTSGKSEINSNKSNSEVNNNSETSTPNNEKTYYIAAGNRYYHKISTCKFIKGANVISTTNISGKFACNCTK
ncbi:MAG: hypothetical protein ACRCYE_08955, partial [Sarcina sp.]